MKGAIDIITIIIVACIVVSIGLMLWFYLNSYYSQVSQSGSAATTKSLGTLSSCMKIEEASQNNFFIRNCGTGLITNNTLNVYIDDNPFSFSLNPASIDAGKTGTLSIQGVGGLPIGQHNLRITNPNFETSALFTAELPDSCVMDLDFDEGSGTKTYDSSGNGNDGMLSNNSASYSCGVSGACPTWVNGKFGEALQFDGIGDYVNVSDSSSLNIIGTSFTITAWIYLNNYTPWGGGYPYTPILERSTDIFAPNPGHGYGLGIYNSNLGLSLGWGSDVVSNLIIGLNKWYYVAVSYSNNGSSVFLSANGLTANYTNQAGYIPFNTNLHIGYNRWVYGGEYFNGTIDSVRIYNQSLTPDQTLNFRLI